MNSLWTFTRRYALTYWGHTALAAGAAVLVTVLNLLSLGLFAAIPQLIMKNFGKGDIFAGAKQPSGDMILGLDINSILMKIGSLADQLSVEYGIVVSIIFVSAAYLLIVILSRLTQLLSEQTLLIAKNYTSRAVVKDMFHHVSNLSMEFFHRRQVGDLASRIIGDTTALSDVVFSTVSMILTVLPLFIFYWALLVVINWKLTLAATVIFALKTLVSRFFAEKIRKNIISSGRIKGKTAGKITEVLANIAIVKTFGMESYEHGVIGGMVDDTAQYNYHQKLLGNIDHTIQTILQSIAGVSIATLGVVMLIDGSIELATLLVFFFSATRTQEPTGKLLRFIMDYYKARGLSVRVLEILKEQATVHDGAKTVNGFKSTIEFRNVSFCYQADKAALHNINLTLHKGEVLAVVGPSGAGKTSLLQLLMRFYDPDEGDILLDGVNLREFRQASHRRLFGVVTQDPILFNASVRDNISYAAVDMEVAEDDVIRAARIAHVDEFVEQWDEGYDTFIGDRGVRLSGGQRQRVTLARAILRNPEILILDEATSSLDSQSERLIQEAVDKFLKDRTAIIVAHRLSTIRKADRIIVMDKGRIVEEGNIKDLLVRRGAFYDLYTAQFGSQDDL